MFSQDRHLFVCVRVRDINLCQAVVRLCSSITPRIEEHIAQNTLVLALDGSERLLLKGEQALVEPSEAHSVQTWPLLSRALTTLFILSGLTSKGFAIGIGATRTLAWLATQQHAQRAAGVVLPEGVTTFLADLPMSALLELPDAMAIASYAEMMAALEASGIRTLGQVQRLPVDSLARRFGADGAALALLASGSDLRPFRPRVPELWLGARLVFDPPLLAHQVMVVLGPLAERLALTLAQRELATGKLALVVESETGKRLQVKRRLAHPLGPTRALLDVAERLFTELLADANAAGKASGVMADVALSDEGERYSTVRLRVGGLRPATAEQRRLWAAEQQQTGAERVARLTAALETLRTLSAGQGGRRDGRQAAALLRAELHEPDAVLPEERYRLAPRMPQEPSHG